MKKIISRCRTAFLDMKLANKMIAIYVMFISVCCIISIMALQVSLNIYDEKLYEKSIQELDFFTQKVNSELEAVEKLSFRLALSNEAQQQLVMISDLDYLSANYRYQMHQYRKLLQNELSPYDMIKNIVFTDRKQTKFVAGVSTGTISQELYNQFLAKLQQARGGYIEQAPTEDYPYLLSGRDILLSLDGSLDYLGTIIFTCDVAHMIEGQIEKLEKKNSTLLVYSEEGTVFCSEGFELGKNLEIKGREGYDIIEYGDEKYFFCYLKSSKNGWTYVNAFPYSSIFGQTMHVRYYMVAGFLILFFGTAMLMRKVVNAVAKPFEQLTDSMQIVENGDFQGAKMALNQEVRRDEVGQLTQNFQKMLDKTHTLIHENYENQLLLKDTEYKMLQAQMNPHFLYNTLNTIHWMTQSGEIKEAGHMLIELGELLRASFAKKHYTTVESDLQLARNYMNIQKLRYEDRVEFTVDVKGNLNNYVIPHMTIQPLVENSIQYGVENTEYCRICIRVWEEEKTILIQVLDNGPGMGAEELENVRNFTATPKGNGIGLRNIKERLEMTYSNCEFTIDSQIQMGTCVTIRVPKVGEDSICLR